MQTVLCVEPGTGFTEQIALKHADAHISAMSNEGDLDLDLNQPTTLFSYKHVSCS